jgi:hypothetical protein
MNSVKLNKWIEVLLDERISNEAAGADARTDQALAVSRARGGPWRAPRHSVV